MDRKYQIFVSSTFEDLQGQREAIIRAILEMGHFPVGMEMFSADDAEQWKIIQKRIDDSDYYVVVVAHRYGSLDAGGMSYTEKEYDYACSRGIPVLGFVIGAGGVWPPAFVDDGEAKKKLDAFKAKVKTKLINYWASTDDLCAKVSIALMKQFNVNPRIGWIRADNVASVDTTNELSRLSKENSLLRQQIQSFHLAESEARQKSESFNEARKVLAATSREISFWYEDGRDWEGVTSVLLRKIFEVLAPELIIEKSLPDSANFLGIMLNPDRNRKPRARFPVPSNVLKLIFADLAALDLVAPSTRKHSLQDKNEYWSLTNKGKKMLTAMRIEKMGGLESVGGV